MRGVSKKRKRGKKGGGSKRTMKGPGETKKKKRGGKKEATHLRTQRGRKKERWGRGSRPYMSRDFGGQKRATRALATSYNDQQQRGERKNRQ